MKYTPQSVSIRVNGVYKIKVPLRMRGGGRFTDNVALLITYTV